MQETYRELPFDQLRTLHREIGALIAERRSNELEELRTKIEILGFTPEEVVGHKKPGRKRKPKEEPIETE